MKEYFIGASIGAGNQHTAAVILERSSNESSWEYHFLKAERFPIGTTYPAAAERIKATCARLEGACSLIIDITGVGTAFTDLLRRQNIHPAAEVNITAGTAETRDVGRWSVPKRDLIGVMQIIIQENRFKPVKTPEIETAVKVIGAYKVNVKLSADPLRAEEAWRENSSDDYVFSVAVALWWAEKCRPYPGHAHSRGVPVRRRRMEW